MFEQLLLQGLRHYAPEIKEHGAPVIKDLLGRLMEEFKPKLREGEENVDIVIEVQDGTPYFMVCAMSGTNQVVRCFEALTTEQLLDKAEHLAKKFNIL